KSEVTYTSATASYVRAGFDKESASISTPWAAASFEREHNEREAKASSTKKVYMIGSWYYPRARLYLKKCTAVNEGFTTAVKAAVDANNATDLLAVFDRYGTAVPEVVEIGGQLVFVHMDVCEGNVSETEIKDTVSAAVSAKTQQAAASVGVGFGNSTSTRV